MEPHYDDIAAVIRNGKVEILHEGGESAYQTKAEYAEGPMFGHFIGAVESADEGEDERYGLLTDLGKWRVRPIFDSIRCWDGEYFSAKPVAFGRCSLFHKSGKVILEEYHLTEGFMSEDLIGSSIPNDKRARSGFRRLDGEWQIKPRFDSATQFIEGRAFVTEGLGAKRKAGIIDRDGEWLRVFSRQVEGFTFEISEGTVGVYQGKTCALMALDGNILCEGEWNLAKGKVIGGVIPVVDFKSKQYGLLDTAGTWKVKPKFFDPIAQVGPFVVFRRDKGIVSDIAVVNTAGEVLWEGPPAI